MTRHPRARKFYRCVECGTLIRKGEVYEYVFGVLGTNKQTIHTCLDCAIIRQGYHKLNFVIGYMWDAVLPVMIQSRSTHVAYWALSPVGRETLVGLLEQEAERRVSNYKSARLSLERN